MLEGKFDPKRIILHVSGAATILFVCGYVLYSLIDSPKVVACSGRYPPATIMAMADARGRLFSANEFKGYIGRAQRGLAENARPALRDGPDGKEPVLQVRMAKGSSDGYSQKTVPGGVGFAWSPSSLEASQSACLAYQLYFPHDFDPGSGGLLPGLYAGKPLRADQFADGQKSAAARLTWSRDGKAAAFVQVPGASHGGNLFSLRHTLPKGRWFPIEQEIVLNDPGQRNGILRLWLDRKLAFEQRNILWRQEPGLGLSGVISEIAYGGPRTAGGAPKTTIVQMTPFGLAWSGEVEVATSERKVSANGR